MALAERWVDIQNPVELEYASLLTPYALSHVVKQLALRSKVGVIQEAGNMCQVSSSEGVLRVTPNKCGCTFWTSTHLPCRHILAVRERKQLPLFSTDLVSHRWTVDYMKEAYDLKLEQMSAETFQVCVHVHVSICRWTVLMHVASVHVTPLYVFNRSQHWAKSTLRPFFRSTKSSTKPQKLPNSFLRCVLKWV